MTITAEVISAPQVAAVRIGNGAAVHAGYRCAPEHIKDGVVQYAATCGAGRRNDAAGELLVPMGAAVRERVTCVKCQTAHRSTVATIHAELSAGAGWRPVVVEPAFNLNEDGRREVRNLDGTPAGKLQAHPLKGYRAERPGYPVGGFVDTQALALAAVDWLTTRPADTIATLSPDYTQVVLGEGVLAVITGRVYDRRGGLVTFMVEPFGRMELGEHLPHGAIGVNGVSRVAAPGLDFDTRVTVWRFTFHPSTPIALAPPCAECGTHAGQGCPVSHPYLGEPF